MRLKVQPLREKEKYTARHYGNPARWIIANGKKYIF